MAEQGLDDITAVEPGTADVSDASVAALPPEETAEQRRVTVDAKHLSNEAHHVEQLDGPEEPGSHTKGRSTLRIYAILIALSLGLFIAALDQTIVATAIPSIVAELHSATGYTWVGGAYLLANAASGPIWVKCSDIWGRKPALLGANVIFAVGSVLAAASTSMPMLIAARAVQGAAGGGVMQLVNITISDLFSIRHRALYISATALVWVLAGTTGPVIGGALSQYVNWRWCFWINLPVCGLAFLTLLLFLDLHNPRTKLGDGLKAVDWFGTLSILAVTLLLLLGLDFGGVAYPWDSPTVICMVVFGTLLIGFFLFAEKRLARYPLLHLGIFKEWPNIVVVLIAVAHSMATIGTEYYLPLYFQSVKQSSPVKSGVLILPMMIAASICDVLVGVLIHQTGRYRELIWAGTTLLTLGTGLYIMLGIDTSLEEIIGFEIIAGVGLSLLLQTPMIAIQNNVNQADTATATATLGFIRSIATSLSIVLGGVVFQNSISVQRSSLVVAGLSESSLEAFSGYEAAANVELIKTIQDPAQHRAVQHAFAWSIRNMFIMYTAIAAFGLLASGFMKQRHMSAEHTETKTGIENMTEHKRKA